MSSRWEKKNTTRLSSFVVSFGSSVLGVLSHCRSCPFCEDRREKKLTMWQIESPRDTFVVSSFIVSFGSSVLGVLSHCRSCPFCEVRTHHATDLTWWILVLFGDPGRHSSCPRNLLIVLGWWAGMLQMHWLWYPTQLPEAFSNRSATQWGT